MTPIPPELENTVLRLVEEGGGRASWHTLATRLPSFDVPLNPDVMTVLKDLLARGLVTRTSVGGGMDAWAITDGGRALLKQPVRAPSSGPLSPAEVTRLAAALRGGAVASTQALLPFVDDGPRMRAVLCQVLAADETIAERVASAGLFLPAPERAPFARALLANKVATVRAALFRAWTPVRADVPGHPLPTVSDADLDDLLRSGLGDSSPDVREAAARLAFVAARGAGLVDALIANVGASEAGPRWWSILALGAASDPHSLALLRRIVAEGNDADASAAIRALGGRADGHDSWLAGLRDARQEVQDAAIFALRNVVKGLTEPQLAALALDRRPQVEHAFAAYRTSQEQGSSPAQRIAKSNMTRIIERHPTGSFELWKDNYDALLKYLAMTAKYPPKSLEALGSVISEAVQCAAVCSFRPEDTDKMCDALGMAAQAAAAAFACAGHDGGRIEARLGSIVITLSALGPGASTVAYGAWLHGLGAALICRDKVAIDVLCKAESIEAAGASVTRGGPSWEPFVHALESLVRADPIGWREYTREARELMKTSPAPGLDLRGSLLDVGDALMSGSKERWNDAVAAALKAHRDYWSVGEKAGYADSLLDVPLAGICALARDRGMETEVESGYMPSVLVTGGCSGIGSEIVYVFPRARARNVEEMHLFMTMQGSPEPHGEHRVVTIDDALVAVYEREAGEGGERLRFEFEMPAGTADDTQPSALIDAGEYLFLADDMAKTVAASPNQLSTARRAEGRAALSRAIDCLREVLKFIPPSQTKVPESAFWTSFGKGVYQREPGRFERRRLEAVLGAWGALLEKYQDGIS